MGAHQQNNVPSTVRVVQLLEGVKDKNGKLLVDKNGILNYEQDTFNKIKYFVAPDNCKMSDAFTNTERKGVIASVKGFFRERKKKI